MDYIKKIIVDENVTFSMHAKDHIKSVDKPRVLGWCIFYWNRKLGLGISTLSCCLFVSTKGFKTVQYEWGC